MNARSSIRAAGWCAVDRQEEAFDPTMATYYGLIAGLHPDEALRVVARAALVRPTILVPRNFWFTEKLGREELLSAIGEYYQAHAARFERVAFPFRGPKNIGLVSEPPLAPGGHESHQEKASKIRC